MRAVGLLVRFFLLVVWVYAFSSVQASFAQATSSLVDENLQSSGVFQGSPAWVNSVFPSSSGELINALLIDSADDALRVADSAALNTSTPDFAVAFWFLPSVQTTAGPTWLNLLHKGATDQQRTFSVWLRASDNRLSYNLSTSTHSAAGALSVNALATGLWSHIAYVKQANQLRLYINGRLDSITAIEGDLLVNPGDLYIGASPWRAAALGRYDQVSVYHRQLTALEIESLYQRYFLNEEMEEHAELKGTPVWITPAAVSGRALRINSNDDSALIANSITFPGYAADFTLAFSIRLEAAANGKWRNLLHKGVSNKQLTFLLMLRPDNNRIYFRLSTTNNWNEGGESVRELPVNQWVQVAYVKQGNTLKLYLDGVLDQSVILSGDMLPNLGPVYIGASPWTQPAFASYDRISVIKRALQSEDIARLAQAKPLAADKGGQWGALIPWPHIPVSAANLPDGRLLTWSGSERAIWPAAEKTYSATWDPQTNQFLEIFHQGHNMFCAHLAMTDQGKVFVNGGRNGSNSPWTSLFDYQNNQWTQVQDMATGGRWYPTTVALPTGEMLTAMGSASNFANPEKWSADQGWQVLNSINFMQMRTTHQGSVGDNRGWPILSVAPTGEVFHFWSNQESFLLNTQGTGQFKNANASGGDASLAPGTAVQYDIGKLLITGNSQGSWGVGGTRQAFTVDLNGPTPVIEAAPPMLFARMFHNLVVLPTGEVLAVGGNTSGVTFSDEGSVYENEIWNPQTRQWRRVSSSGVPRNYHSVATLLTDGRVLSAGGGYCGGNELCGGASHQNGQIYTPPYLFKADGSLAERPQISAGPGVIKAGEIFTVSVSGNVQRFTLIKMSATTHAVNTDTRFISLPFVSQGNNQFNLTAEANPNVLIPGYWMLFALNENNVPSVAKVIRVEKNNTVTTPGPNRFVKLVAKSEVAGNPWISLAELTVLDANQQPIDPTYWTITANSQNSNHTAQAAIDGNANTVWHTEWKVNVIPSPPHTLTIDMRQSYALHGLTYLGRQDQPYGRINAYDVFVSSDGSHWQLAAAGNFANTPQLQTVQFGQGLAELSIPATTPVTNNQAASFVLPAGFEYEWNWGDGSPGQAFNIDNNQANHTYTQPGIYVIVLNVRDPVSGLERSITTQQVVYDASIDLAQRGLSSSPIQFHPQRAQVWNVNPDNHTVSVVDSNTFMKLAEINVGQQPSCVAFADNGDVWVTNKTSGTLSVIDAETFTVTHTLSLPNFASRPHGLVMRNGFAYVVLEATHQLVKIEVSSRAVVATLSLLTNPRHVAMSVDGSTLYVSNFITPALVGESTATPDVSQGVAGVAVVQASNLTLLNTLLVQHSDDLITENTGPGIPNYLGALAIHPAQGPAYLPAKQDNILGGSLRGGSLSFDQTVRAVSVQFNLGTNTESVAARIDHDNASVASAAVYGPYGIHLFTALEGNRQVAISNTLTGSEIARFTVGRAPQGLALSPNGQILAIQNFMDRTVELADISDVVQHGGTLTQTLATVPVVATEALTPEVLLGKQLFYDSADDRLAALDYMSCASCHNEGSHDGRVWDFTQFGEGLRNTTTLRGKGGMAHGLLHWSGNFDEVQDFEGQIRNFAGGAGLMNDVDFFVGTRSLPLGDRKTGLSPDLDALAAYISSLNTTDDSPLKSSSGLSPLAVQGQDLFNHYQCASCHAGTTFTDSLTQVRHDVGTLNTASGMRLAQTLDGLDTPTLLGLSFTAPYLHNGAAANLQAAIAAHNTPAVNNGVPLSTTDRDALAAYLLEIP